MENSKLGVSDRLRYLIQLKNMNIKQFADYVSIPKGTLEKYLNNNRLPSAELLSALHSKMGVSAHWILDEIEPMYLVDAGAMERAGVDLLREGPFWGPGDLGNVGNENPTITQGNPDFVPIPRFAVDAAAGDGALVDEETQTGFYAFNRSWLTKRKLAPDNLAVISVRGDSMEPRLSDGDLILVDQAQVEIADGITYVIRLGNDLLVKYVQRISPDAVSLLSENNRYPPREISLATIGEDTAIIGRVVASMHEW